MSKVLDERDFMMEDRSKTVPTMILLCYTYVYTVTNFKKDKH